MIVVIADDITGAAEMAGIALRYGQNVVVSDEVNTNYNADVLVIYTNTRSMSKKEAVNVMEGLTEKAMLLQPSLFYKKTDSVLRGYIIPEMKAQMKAMNVDKGLLVPANPSLGRVIRNGKYYVNNQLIHQTAFSHDPEFPIKTSDVAEMLPGEDVEVKVLSKNESLLKNGISVGEAASSDDISQWATYHHKSVLPAGGACFFNAILAKKHQPQFTNTKSADLTLPLVLISGTTYQKNVQKIKSYSNLVSYMPESIFSDDHSGTKDFEKWLDDIAAILSKYDKVILAVNSTGKKSNPVLLREKKAEIVKLIFKKIKIKELLIEGGSTAYSIVKELGWHSFIPTAEIQQGIVRMKVGGTSDLHLTIKPGSYEWPAQWKFN